MPRGSKPEPDQTLSGGHIQAMDLLTQGRGLAFQLRDLLLEDQIPISGDRLVLAEGLLEKIRGSFTESISALDLADSETTVEIKSEESSRPSTTFPGARKGGSRRKRREMSEEDQSWTVIASTLVHDGHAWRKYGQKPILNAKYSRNYFKCTHKENLGCPAKKHVQKIGDDPISYRIVYSFRHTCTTTTNISHNPPAEAARMILESAADDQPADHVEPGSSIMVNFQSDKHQHDFDWNNNYNNAFLSSELKQEQINQSNGFPSVRSLSDVAREVPYASFAMSDACMGTDEFMNCSNNYSYSPYIPYSEEAEDPWLY